MFHKLNVSYKKIVMSVNRDFSIEKLLSSFEFSSYDKISSAAKIAYPVFIA